MQIFGKYVIGDVTTNRVEGYFSLVKRGIDGVYHHVGKNKLQLYLNEFDFRFNSREISDHARAIQAIMGAEGKRMKLRG